MSRKKIETNKLDEISDSKIFMTEAELRKINEDSYVHQLKKQELEILSLKLKCAELKAEAEIAKLNLDIFLKTQEFSAFKEQSAVLQKEISQKYKISENWGFHPDTGEIIIDE